MTTQEAARALGRTDAQVRRLFRQGKLAGEKIGQRTILVRDESVRAYAAVKHNRGWPKGKARKAAAPETPPDGR